MIQKLPFFSQPANASIVLVYKNKILLTSKETTYPTNKHNIWSFFEKSSLEKLRIKIPEMIRMGRLLFCIRLTDKNVNDLTRQKGDILEFYTFKEIDRIKLSINSKSALEANRSIIKSLLLSGRV